MPEQDPMRSPVGPGQAPHQRDHHGRGAFGILPPGLAIQGPVEVVAEHGLPPSHRELDAGPLHVRGRIALQVVECGSHRGCVQDRVGERAKGTEIEDHSEVEAQSIVSRLVGGALEENEQLREVEHAVGVGEVALAQPRRFQRPLR
jgi:hypothetical protein